MVPKNLQKSFQRCRLDTGTAEKVFDQIYRRSREMLVPIHGQFAFIAQLCRLDLIIFTKVKNQINAKFVKFVKVLGLYSVVCKQTGCCSSSQFVYIIMHYRPEKVRQNIFNLYKTRKQEILISAEVLYKLYIIVG